MTAHRIPACPHQLQRLRSGERIVLVERCEMVMSSDFGPIHRSPPPYLPGDVLEFFIADQTEGYIAVIRGEETSWTRTVSSVTAKLGRDVTERDLELAGVLNWVSAADPIEPISDDQWYWIVEAT